MESIFENLENLNVSEECFEEILRIVEELINETRRINKEAHQEAFFKRVSPEGEYAPITRHSHKSAIKNLSNAKVTFYGDGEGVAHTMRDYRDVLNTDSPDSAPRYDEETREHVKPWVAQEVRRILGRDDEFSNAPVKSSRSHEVAKKYMDFKKAVKDAKNK